MRVLITSGTFKENADGVARTLLRFSESLAKERIEHAVLAPLVENSESPFLRVKRVFSFPAPGYKDYRVSIPGIGVYRCLRSFKPDIMHIATPDVLGLFALVFAMLNRIPRFATYHTHFPSYLQYYKLNWLEGAVWAYLRWFYRRCETLFVPTEEIKTLLASKGIVNTVVWGRGIETRYFNPSRRDTSLRGTWGGDDKFYVAYAGRLVWYKALGVFRDVALKLKEHPKIRFVLIGDGPAGPELKKQLKHAIFLGHIPKAEVGRMIASSDLLLFPSITETFGQVVLEALACGIPAVVSNQGGPTEIVTKAGAGTVVPAGDIDVFANAVSQYANDAEFYKAAATRGWQYTADKDWDTINNIVIKAYRDFLNPNRSDSAPSNASSNSA